MTTAEERRKRVGTFNTKRWRNLKQYKDLSDEEYNEVMDQMKQGIVHASELDKRIEQKIKEFAEDYDLDDLKINDLLTLRALAQTYISLEDFENLFYNLRKEGVSMDDMLNMDKLNNILSGLRKDISNMQTDLSITRRVRKSDKETNVITYIDDLKQKAKEFYEERMTYIYCPKCNNLLFTGWFHYPFSKENKLQLICSRILDNGETCGNKFQVTIKDIMNDKNRGVNIDDVPETFK